MFPLVADQEEFGLLKGLYGSICPQGRGGWLGLAREKSIYINLY